MANEIVIAQTAIDDEDQAKTPARIAHHIHRSVDRQRADAVEAGFATWARVSWNIGLMLTG
ncbi:hypothetical protein [Streptomyces murinus]|uniref:hypothetical protein n=1 Tax=Streptomyces murinus TaxID=33900 RepID=UPI00211519C0|nr:hypothetical protein [Streptomyces murinus]